MNRKVIIAVIVLAVVVGVTAFLNRGDLAFKDESQEKAFLVITSKGNEVAKVDMDFIRDLGETDFEANLKKSGKDPVRHTYTGVPLKAVLEACDVDIEGKSMIVAKAVDGYTSALTLDEAMEEDNVYIVYKLDGEPLGKKEEGGSGPYQLVISKDPFSQRWCKFLMEIELQ